MTDLWRKLARKLPIRKTNKAANVETTRNYGFLSDGTVVQPGLPAVYASPRYHGRDPMHPDRHQNSEGVKSERNQNSSVQGHPSGILHFP